MAIKSTAHIQSKEDNTAIPEEEKTLEGIVGVELRQGRLTGKLQEDIPPGLL